MDRLTSINNNIMQYFDKSNKSVLGTVIRSITSEIKDTDVRLKIIDDMLGISTTPDIYLEERWGSILDMPMKADESYDTYRNRLKLAMNVDNSGTVRAIIRAIAVVLDIDGDSVAMEKQIQIYDAWEYTGEYDVVRDPGYIVCIIDINYREYDKYNDITDAIRKAIISTKASGIIAQMVLTNFRISTYEQMESYSYQELAGIKYDQLGDGAIIRFSV